MALGYVGTNNGFQFTKEQEEAWNQALPYSASGAGGSNLAFDYSKVKWSDILAKAQEDYNLQRNGGGFDSNGVYRNYGKGDTFDYATSGRTTVGGLPAQISFGAGVNPDSINWDQATFNYKDPNGTKGMLQSLYRKEDGSVGMREYQDTGDMGFLMDMVKFAAAASGMNGAVNALGASTGAATTSGGLFGNGGLYGTGVSTGSTAGDWLAKKVIGQGISSAAGSLFNGDGSPTRASNNGGFKMADGNSLADLLFSGYVSNNNIGRIEDVANTSATNIQNIANTLKDQGKFTPYNIRTGVGGSVDVGNGEQHTYLSPKWQQFQDQTMAQIPGLLEPYQNAAVTGLSGKAYGLANEWFDKRANPLYAANEQKGLFGSGQMLDKAAAFDPEANAKIEYDLMQKLFAPTREQDNLNMENRLMNQGRLGLSYGSVGAAPELAALKEAQRMQDLSATKDSRQLAYDRQNNLISQAGALGDIGIRSGAAGTAQQQAYYNMADGLFKSGMSGDKFMEDMNNSRANRASLFQGMAMKPEEFVQRTTDQALSAGNSRSQAEQANARLFGNLSLDAERMRTQGAGLAAALKNERDKNMLNGAVGGAGGLLGGGMEKITGLAKQLLGMGVPKESLTQVMSEMGINMDQFTDDWNFDLSDLEFSDAVNMEGLDLSGIDLDLFDF